MIKKVKKETLTTAHYALLYEADPAKKNGGRLYYPRHLL